MGTSLDPAAEAEEVEHKFENSKVTETIPKTRKKTNLLRDGESNSDRDGTTLEMRASYANHYTTSEDISPSCYII